MGSSNSNRYNRNMEDSSESSDRDSSGSTSSSPDLISILQYLIRNNDQMRVITRSGRNYEEESEEEDNGGGSQQEEQACSLDRIVNSRFQQDTLLGSGNVWKAGFELPKSVLRMVQNRELGMNGTQNFSRGDRCLVSSRFLPNKGQVIQRYRNKAFCGTYSQDGRLFLTACQDRNIRIYNAENREFRVLKTIEARDMGWSILDTALSPDGNFLIYSSWSECIHLCNIYGDYERHEALPLCPEDRRFCIFSLTFSQDGLEILGGANDGCLYVYDINAKSRKFKIAAHEDDVNTVAFADATSQILFSGSDDGLCKVWDRRLLDESHPKPVGVLAGHKDGITYIDSRGDGRHLITNCKDQSIKLWDMRIFSSSEGLDSTKKAIRSSGWDYRWQKVPKKYFSYKQLNGDVSLMTYTGHHVLQTLIRCHFSPAFTTGQQFIYSGCASGNIVVFDVLTGKIVKELMKHRACVRDVSWHPYQNDLVSTSWDGSVVRWTYEEDLEDDPDLVFVPVNLSQSGGVSSRSSQKRYNLRSMPAMKY